MSKKLSIVTLTIISIVLILGIVFAFLPLNNGELGTHDYNPYPSQIKLGLDLKGGIYAVYSVKDNDSEKVKNMTAQELNDTLKGTANSLESLLFSKGYPEAVVSMSGSGLDTKIRVEVPDVDDPEQIFELIGRPKSLHLKKTNDKNFDETSDDVVLTGSNVVSANVTLDENGQYAVALEFDEEGTKAFADVTKELMNNKIYIFAGKELLLDPTVRAHITDGKTIITGGYTYDQAYDLAVAIQSGSFALPLYMEESATISPTLGENAIQSGIIAGAIGLAFIVVFLSCVYGLMGVAASISLIWYTLTYVFFLSIFPWVQLTLPGIAGILLSIGMAVDANVIIFERIKEEYRTSNRKSMRTCVKNGFKRSLSAIIDGNVTSVIGAIVLMFIATASIKGFAITLLIGILISLISSLLVTSLIMQCFLAFTANPKVYKLKKGLKDEDNNTSDNANVDEALTEGGKA